MFKTELDVANCRPKLSQKKPAKRQSDSSTLLWTQLSYFLLLSSTFMQAFRSPVPGKYLVHSMTIIAKMKLSARKSYVRA